MSKVRRTPNQVKKHFSSFTENESQLLSIIVGNLLNERLYILPHAYSHVSNLELDDIYNTLSDCKILEFNITNQESPRVLVRANHPTHFNMVDGVETNYNLCVVIDIKSNCVITCYCNEQYDEHTTLDDSRYNPELNIIGIALNLN
jgi:hypothetical protein